MEINTGHTQSIPLRLHRCIHRSCIKSQFCCTVFLAIFGQAFIVVFLAGSAKSCSLPFGVLHQILRLTNHVLRQKMHQIFNMYPFLYLIRQYVLLDRLGKPLPLNLGLVLINTPDQYPINTFLQENIVV